MVRVYAPGLPTWPALYFDPTKRHALISTRLVTWRSKARARILMLVVVWTIIAFSFIYMMRNLDVGEYSRRGNENAARLLASLIGTVIVAVLIKRPIPWVFSSFVARQIFPQRVSIWFTPQWIAFRSPIYLRGVKVWRHFRGVPVQGKFDVRDDLEAVVGRISSTRNQDPSLESAMTIRLIISTALDSDETLAERNNGNFMREIPICDADQRVASQLTIILGAAASLTSSQNIPMAEKTGVDIDLET
tara:strand:+ start:3810 stop:4550 length:741 start_codon:yes stop_codon:yes gene_type:complete